MELMIVMAIVGVLTVVAVPSFVGAIRQAREAALKEDLHVMRAAIDSYTMDKQKAPQSLDDLITDGYLRAIPEDPFTHAKDTWVTRHRRCAALARPDRPRHRRRPLRLAGDWHATASPTPPGRRKDRIADRRGKNASTDSIEGSPSCFAWPPLCGCLFAQSEKTITIRMLDGKTGKPIEASGFLVRVDHEQTVHADWVVQNEDGTGKLTLPRGRHSRFRFAGPTIIPRRSSSTATPQARRRTRSIAGMRSPRS